MRTFLLVMALALVSCGNDQDGGIECKVNADCDLGLSCLATVAISSNGSCAATGKKVCTKQCVTSAECIITVPVCQTSCLGLMTCGNATR